jgi:hypothetical protein
MYCLAIFDFGLLIGCNLSALTPIASLPPNLILQTKIINTLSEVLNLCATPQEEREELSQAFRTDVGNYDQKVRHGSRLRP